MPRDVENMKRVWTFIFKIFKFEKFLFIDLLLTIFAFGSIHSIVLLKNVEEVKIRITLKRI